MAKIRKERTYHIDSLISIEKCVETLAQVDQDMTNALCSAPHLGMRLVVGLRTRERQQCVKTKREQVRSKLTYFGGSHNCPSPGDWNWISVGIYVENLKNPRLDNVQSRRRPQQTTVRYSAHSRTCRRIANPRRARFRCATYADLRFRGSSAIFV